MIVKIIDCLLIIVKYFANINEILYISLDYSDAKTITGLIVFICFITIIVFHLFLNKD